MVSRLPGSSLCTNSSTSCWTPHPLLRSSTDKMLKTVIFDCWQEELECLQSPVASDGCWPETGGDLAAAL